MAVSGAVSPRSSPPVPRRPAPRHRRPGRRRGQPGGPPAILSAAPVRHRAPVRRGSRGSARRVLPRDRRRRDRAEPEAAAAGLRRGGAGRARALDPGVRAAAAVVVREAGGRARYELVMGERRLRAAQRAGLHRPGDRPATPPTTPCCATRCWRTSTGSSSTRSRRPRPTSSCWRSSASPTRSWPIGSAAAARCDQHDPADEAAGEGAAPGRRRRHLGRATPARCSGWRTPRRQEDARGADRRRGHVGAGHRGSRAAGRREKPPAPRRPAEAGVTPGARSRRAALGHVRHPGAGRDRPAQGPDRRGVRIGRRPGADRHAHGRHHGLTDNEAGAVFHVEHGPCCFTGTSAVSRDLGAPGRVVFHVKQRGSRRDGPRGT